MPTVAAAEISALVSRIMTAPTGARSERAVEHTIESLYPHFRVWTMRLIREFGRDNFSYFDDVVGICAEQTWLMLLHSTAEVTSGWYSYIHGACRNQVRAFFESGAVTAASGMTAVIRKQRAASSARQRMTSETGAEPRPHELVMEMNAITRETRSNSSKQGALLTEEDLLVPTISTEIDEGHVLASVEEFPITEWEARDLIAMLIEECEQHSDDLADAATLWLGQLYNEPPFIRTTGEIAADMEIAPQRASKLVKRVREIALELCEERFGICAPTLGWIAQ